MVSFGGQVVRVHVYVSKGRGFKFWSVIESGLRVYSTRYTEQNTKINIECPQ